MAALAYQAIFRIPITDLFPGLYETVAQGIEERLLAVEDSLQNSSPRSRQAHITATKLVWLNERKNSTITDSKE